MGFYTIDTEIAKRAHEDSEWHLAELQREQDSPDVDRETQCVHNRPAQLNQQLTRMGTGFQRSWNTER